MEPCKLQRNPGNARLSSSRFYDLYACAAASNAKDNKELHVVSVFYAKNGIMKVRRGREDGGRDSVERREREGEGE